MHAGAMTLEIRLHDTRTGRKLPLEPRDPGRVGIYSCGPTVYNRIHIGNARPFVVPSLFKRFRTGGSTDLELRVEVVNVFGYPRHPSHTSMAWRARPSGDIREPNSS